MRFFYADTLPDDRSLINLNQTKQMFSKAWFILRYWIGWIIFFQLARLTFLFSNYSLAKTAGLRNFFGSLFYGARMDMSMAAYISLPVCFFVLLAVFFKPFRAAVLYKVYTTVILLPVLLLIFTDIGLYKEWGFRIDSTFLKYLANPAEAWASVSHLPIISILLLFILLYSLLVFFSRKLITKYIAALQRSDKKILAFIVIFFLTGLFIIPLRGGFQLAPLNQSSVYFSQDHFSNLAAINASWNFMYALNHNTQSTQNPFVYLEKKEAARITDSLQQAAAIQLQHRTTKPNVIVIVWESFTEKVLDLKKDGIEITPGFNLLRKEGIYFSNIYATGDRTDKGIVAVLSGYPSQPTTSVVKIPSKAASLPALGKTYKTAGYNTAFYYGGELEFANMKAYLLAGGFDRFVSVNDFEKKDQNSKWGAHDGVVMNKLVKEVAQARQPFFYTWLTLSSHEPFETPQAPVIKGDDWESQFLNSLHYSDKIVYDFIEQCKKQPWWQNTIVAIVADHGHPLPEAASKTKNFRIPMLLLGGLITQPQQVDKTGSQTDLAAILLSQTGISHKDFAWSKNLLDSTTKSRAYFAFNNGFGFVNDSGYFVFDNVGKRVMEAYGTDTAALRLAGQAMQQQSFADYLER